MNKEQLEIVRKDIELATGCGLTISYQKDGYSISISQNGKGYNVAYLTRGNLKDMEYGLTLSNAVESFKLWIERGCKL